MKPHRPIVQQIIAIAALLWALNPDNPYGYYTVLRVVVSGLSVYLGVCAHASRHQPWVWLFGAVAILFNPIIPIHLTREIWFLLDLLVAALLAVSLVALSPAKASQNK